MPLFPVLERQRQVDFYKFEASLVCRANSRTTRDIQRHPTLNKQKSATKVMQTVCTLPSFVHYHLPTMEHWSQLKLKVFTTNCSHFTIYLSMASFNFRTHTRIIHSFVRYPQSSLICVNFLIDRQIERLTGNITFCFRSG